MADGAAEDVGTAEVIEAIEDAPDLTDRPVDGPAPEFDAVEIPDSPLSEVSPDATDVRDFTEPHPGLPSLGGRFTTEGTRVQVVAPNATRVEAWFYDEPFGEPEIARLNLGSDAGVWSGVLDAHWPPYYGLRAWGPNWEYDDEWEPGSERGFVADVDALGNRFNPNKLLIDPYALGLSHDPIGPRWEDSGVYRSGEGNRTRDSALVAPKGELFWVTEQERPARPERPLHEDVIYEVHLRGLTMADPDVPSEIRGTYAGAASRARYLAELGVTAVEFLPLHEAQNDQNDIEVGTAGDNYWGYASLSFFAPERRFAADQSVGGPLNELIEMVDAFHQEGIKVFVDVVYNHTAEGSAWDDGTTAQISSWRGLDNTAWYQVVDGSSYRNDNGVGPNLAFGTSIPGEAVMDSLRFYTDVVGVDGFRFDLAALLGNSCVEDCFEFDSGALLTDIATEFARGPEGGVDLIAEPWGTTAGTYRIGEFPNGWHEWNDRYRVTVRAALNEPWSAPTPAELTMRIHGSSDLFRGGGRGPDAGVGYVVSHDGLTWGDLFQCADRDNDQPWPFGPSDGGAEYNQSADYGGDEAAQRQAARTAFALMTASNGVPMLTGGDEFLRTQRCNNNPYNLDSPGNWLDWANADEAEPHRLFVERMLAFRAAQPALHPSAWTEGVDRDEDGLPDVSWLDGAAQTPTEDYWNSGSSPIIAWRVDGDESGEGDRSIYVAWNRSREFASVQLPETDPATRWHRVTDTAAWLEFDANSYPLGEEPAMPGASYDMHPQSLLILVER